MKNLYIVYDERGVKIGETTRQRQADAYKSANPKARIDVSTTESQTDYSTLPVLNQ